MYLANHGNRPAPALSSHAGVLGIDDGRDKDGLSERKERLTALI